MVTPRWVKTRTQPIAIEDMVAYLVEALDHQPDGGEVFEIGGADVCSYLDLMHEYAEQRGLRREMVPVPVLTPRSRASGFISSRPCTPGSAVNWSTACATRR